MTDYNPIFATETDPEAPLRSSLFKRIVANPIATAEGAPGAPRVKGWALDTFLGRLTANGTTAVGLADIERYELIRCDLGFAATGNVYLQARYSDDGGANWGSWQDLISLGVGGVGNQGMGFMRINLRTGQYEANATSVNTDSGGNSFPRRAAGTHTIPSGYNAIQFRNQTSAMTVYIDAYCLGGLTV